MLSDPLIGAEAVPEEELRTLAQSAPNAARAVLALHRALRVAREDAAGLALPTGRRIVLPIEETRDFFHDRANHFPVLRSTGRAHRQRTRRPPAGDEPRYRRTAAQPPRADRTRRPACGRGTALRSGRTAARTVGDTAARIPRLPHGFPTHAARGARGGGTNAAGRASSPEAGCDDSHRPAELCRRRAADALRTLPFRPRANCATTSRPWPPASA